MKKLFGSKKFSLFFSLGISLLAVFSATIATAAWFQLETQPITTNLVTSSPNLQVDNSNVASYKIPQTANANGFVNYTTDTTQRTVAENITVDNGNQASADINFNVPQDGIGYYLVKKNSGDTYTFSYYGNTMSWKLTQIEGTTRYYNESVSLTAGDLLCVKNYDFSYHTTQITDRALNSCSHGGTLSSNVVTVTSSGTYKVWLSNSSGNWDLSLESTGYDAQSINRSRAIGTGPKRAVSGTVVDNNYRFNVIVLSNNVNVFNDGAKLQYGYLSSTVNFWGDFGSTEMDSDIGTAGSYGSSNYARKLNYQIDDKDAYFVTLSLGTNFTTTYYDVLIRRHGSSYWDEAKIENGQVWTNAGNTYEYWINDGAGGRCLGNYFKVAYHSGVNYDQHTYNLVKADNFNPDDTQAKTISGYTFKGWYKDPSCTTPYVTTTLTGDINLYAKYEKDGGDTSSTNTIYLYLNGKTDWGALDTLYCYAFDGSGKYSTFDNVFIPADCAYSGSKSILTTIGGTTYYEYTFTISSSFPSIIFRKYDNFDSGYYCDQTVNIDLTDRDGDYYVITGPSSEGDNKSPTTYKWQGSWYSSISAVSSTMVDYYVFDQEDYLKENSGTPSIYAWKDNDSDNDTFYIPANSANAVENAAWPGEALLSTEGSNGITDLPEHVYRFRVSETYDSFILNNGKNRGASQAFQTQDLTPDVSDGGTGNLGLPGHGSTPGSARSSSTYYFVFSGKHGKDKDGNEAQGNNIVYYEVSGSWELNITTVSLNISFGLNISGTFTPLSTLSATPVNGNTAISNGVLHLANQFHKSGMQYTPSTYTSITSLSSFGVSNTGYIDVPDSTNNILYNFSISSITWYKDSACTNAYVAASDTTYTGNLFIKASMDASDLTTIYIDSLSWGEAPTIKDSGKETSYFTCSNAVAPNLYLITLPSNWMFHASYTSTSTSTSSAINMSSRADSKFVYLSGTSGAWKSLSEISIGTAVLQVYENGDWVDKINMDIGDIHHYDASEFSNYFVYELGFRMGVGTKFQIVVTANSNGSTNYGLVTKTYDVTSDYSGSLPNFITDSSGFTTTGYSGYARFNFYITNDNKLSVAMVPDYGNGYYIMQLGAGDGQNSSTASYNNGNKMNNDSTYASASYVGYYVSGETTIYIRKYIDAVDTLITGAGTFEDGCATMPTPSNGKVTISSKGYYIISVDSSGRISVSKYAGISDAFKLNPLDTSKTTRSGIKSQKTTLFLEVPFKANNTYSTEVSLEVSNPLYEFVGVGLYVSSTQLTTANIYSTLTADAYYNNLTKFYNSSKTTITNLNSGFTGTTAETVGTSDSSARTYYAYIIIDYLPTDINDNNSNPLGNYTNFSDSTYVNSYLLGFSLIGGQL